MVVICYILSILATFILDETTGTCPLGPDQPQLSTAFLNGYWYEHLYVNTVLNDNACSHFEIMCNSSTSSCEVEHVIWHSYLLDQVSNGTITEKEGTVALTINKENTSATYSDVKLKFEDDAVLLWACNDTEIEFASVLIRMEDDEDMAKVWGEATSNMNYLNIIEAFPAGIWKKIDPTDCTNYGGVIYPTFSPYLLVVILLLINTYQKIYM